MENEQAVVETDVVAPPTTEDNSAQDLDQLLSEYEQETQPKAEPPIDENETKELLSYFKEERRNKIIEKTNNDIKSAVDTIKNGLDIKLPDKVVKGMLYEIAESDPRVAKAFQERDQNPQKWNQVLKGLQGEIAKEFESLPDAKLTEDKEAVMAAVRSANKQPEQKVDDSAIRKMSLGELYKNFPELSKNF